MLPHFCSSSKEVRAGTWKQELLNLELLVLTSYIVGASRSRHQSCLVQPELRAKERQKKVSKKDS